MCNLQTVSGFLLCGTLLDIGVWYYVKDLQIYDKETETDDTITEKNSMKWRRRREEQLKRDKADENLKEVFDT
jgi:hypothetical protein